MISMPLIEKVLLEKYGNTDEVVLAIEGSDTDTTNITCFTTQELTLHEINQTLKDAGLSNIMRITHIQIISEIPLLGSGKTDYKQLKTLL